jgi:uncharacterized protein
MTPDDKSNTSAPEKVPHDHHDIESVSATSAPQFVDESPSEADKARFSDALVVDGEIDMRIGRDGTWYYLGSAITRKPLVKLFSTVLRREDDGEYYLITPVEKARIQVDDAPFTAVEMTVTGDGEKQTLTFRTNVDEEITADALHPLRLELDDETGEPSPYILVRDNLEALIVRSVFYDLVALGVELTHSENSVDKRVLGVWSSGTCFKLGHMGEE